MRCLLLTLLLAACVPYGVYGYPSDLADDKKKVKGLPAKFAAIVKEKDLDNAQLKAELATEAGKTLQLASKNKNEAKKGNNGQLKKQAREEEEEAAKVLAEASILVVRDYSKVLQNARKGLREARRDGNKENIKKCKEIMEDMRQKVCAMLCCSQYRSHIIRTLTSFYSFPSIA